MNKPLDRKWDEKKTMTILAYSIVVKWYHHHVIISTDQIPKKKSHWNYGNVSFMTPQFQQMLPISI